MDKFTLTITMGNDAMQDELDVARALEKVSDSLRRGQTVQGEHPRRQR